MNYIAFNFATAGPDQSEQLVALLSDQGFEGFEEAGNSLHAFIPEEIFNEDAFGDIEELYPSLVYTKSIVENINWNRQWEESFEPVLVNNFVAIRAGFHQSIDTVAHEIVITPKMSFGTGHHATTHLMVQQMQGIDFNGKTVLDFGTGTGILAILAEKLGASKIMAIDNDEWSITNAKENILQNECDKIIIEQRDDISLTEKYDIVLANINLNVITANLKAIQLVSTTGGNVVLSGFLNDDEPFLIAEITTAGFQYISTSQRGEWIAIRATQ
jgi:ribosomal protein L11 methyltransferase